MLNLYEWLEEYKKVLKLSTLFNSAGMIGDSTGRYYRTGSLYTHEEQELINFLEKMTNFTFHIK